MGDKYLILENGDVFKGKAFGYDGDAVGELVFSTGMTGYLEALADPAYYGQIVLQTFPLVGNYGVNQEDFGTGPIHLKAYIVRQWCQEPSNFRSEGNLDSFLRENKIPGICGMDTRELTRVIRNNGTMNAMLLNTPELTENQWEQLRNYKITDAVKSVATAIANSKSKIKNSKFRVAVWDFGGAYRLTQGLNDSGCDVTVFAYDATAEEVISGKPDGVALTGGPGDPSENTEIIKEIKKLCEKNIPIFAVGLGHQLLALAKGAKTQKLPFGHRGANQAVKEINSASAFVSVQNHGYVVASDSLPQNAVMSHINVNDNTCEGISYMDIPALSVSFEPTDEIFEKFKAMMEGGLESASE